MCQTKAEGGKRCATHTRPRYEKTKAALAALPAGALDAQVLAATDQYREAARQYASTNSGRTRLGDRLRVLRGGAAPEVSQEADVLADVLGVDLRAEREKAEAKEAFQRSLRTGEPVPAHLRVTRTVAPPVDSPLERLIRNGGTRVPEPDVDPHQPYLCEGGIVIPTGQRPLVERWGNDPVVVRARPDVQAPGGGWSEWLADGGSRVIKGIGPVERGDGSRMHGVVVTTHVETGQQVGLRAVFNRDTGVWTVLGPQRTQ